MRPRTLARRLALQYLYILDVNPHAESLDDFLGVHGDNGEASRFAGELVGAVQRNREAIDTALAESAAHWSIERMAPVERNALRIGVGEILYAASPAPVAIEEAVKLAKTFGGKNSGAFVNGVLDAVHQRLDLRKASADE